MKITIRIPGVLYDEAKADLERPHPFAAERVGFFATSLLPDVDEPLICITGYHPVADSDYIDDLRSGARINSRAIRASLQRILDDQCGQLHAHIHGHCGEPFPSGMDQRELPPLVRSMVAVGSTQAHGGIILSEDSASATLWIPKVSEPLTASRISVVGFPLRYLK
jgi:hypothetical protein